MSKIEIVTSDNVGSPDWLSHYDAYCNSLLQLISLERVGFSVFFCDNLIMRVFNKNYRGVDSSTDVLSFSIFPNGYPFTSHALRSQPCTGDDFMCDGVLHHYLGDIVISLEQAGLQATNHTNDIEQEVQHLTVHGVLHLLGYNHALNPDPSGDSMLLIQSQIIAQMELQFSL